MLLNSPSVCVLPLHPLSFPSSLPPLWLVTTLDCCYYVMMLAATGYMVSRLLCSEKCSGLITLMSIMAIAPISLHVTYMWPLASVNVLTYWSITIDLLGPVASSRRWGSPYARIQVCMDTCWLPVVGASVNIATIMQNSTVLPNTCYWTLIDHLGWFAGFNHNICGFRCWCCILPLRCRVSLVYQRSITAIEKLNIDK